VAQTEEERAISNRNSQRLWREKNPGRSRAHKTNWNKTERGIENTLRYKTRNKEAHLLYNKEYMSRPENRARVSKMAAIRYRENRTNLSPEERALRNARSQKSARANKNYEANKKRYALKHRAKKYNISPEQCEIIKEFGCDVCGTNTGRLCIDHDHTTGRVRGCLCNTCNTSLGQMKESVGLLGNMIEYINRHKKSLYG
jgi:hypothetical protein